MEPRGRGRVETGAFCIGTMVARYEFAVRLNMAASCAPAGTVADILALGGPGAREEYLRLNLDYIPYYGV
ncbi:MAG: hypothetical protein ACOYU7_01500 [Bacillota bacterium]